MFSPDSRLSRTLSAAFDIIVIGIIWFVSSLLIVTVCDASTAAYYTMSKVVRHGEGYLLEEYRHSFRMNFRQSVVPAIAFVFVSIVLVLDIVYVWTNRSAGNDMMFIILAGVSACVLMVSLYFPPFLSRFQKSNMELLRLSAFSAFRFLPVTIGCLLAAALMLLAIWLMPWAIVVLPGVYIYLLTYPMEYVMRRYMAKPEEGSAEAEKWYYK